MTNNWQQTVYIVFQKQIKLISFVNDPAWQVSKSLDSPI